MYEAVHARPDGEQSIATLAATAADYGFDGVIVRNHDGARTDADLDAVAADVGIGVVDGVEIRADSPQHASGSVGNFRPDYTVVGIHGGTTTMNRYAVETDKVDVLAHPMTGEGDVNHVLVKAAADNAVRIEFDLGPVLRQEGGRRVRALQSLRKLHELVEHYDAPYVVSAEPRSHLELRAPRELAALGDQIGLGREWVERGLCEWGRLVDRNREIESASFVEPGVRRGRDEPEERDRDGL